MIVYTFRKTNGFRVAIKIAMSVAISVAFLGTIAAAVATEKHTVFPEKILFDGNRQRACLLVSEVLDDHGSVKDLTRASSYTSSNQDVVRIEEGVASPVGNGKATVTVSHGDWSKQVAVEVSNQDADDVVSLHYEVLPLLTRHSCNSGGCHGAPKGKGGFRLSLFAYDPPLDVLTLTKEDSARRANSFHPSLSLLLQKPSMRVAHGGGQRLKQNDISYRILKQWIAEGCKSDIESSRRCESIEIRPGNRVLRFPDWQQQLVVNANYSDGSKRDITHLTNVFSSDETIATIDQQGLVTGKNHGETALVVRYLEHVAAVRLTFIKPVANFVWSNPTGLNLVDRHVYSKLKQMQFQPSKLADDHTFVRRIYLDLIGILPTKAEAHQFATSKAANKRNALIDQLLDRPEYARFWANRWADLFRANNETLGEKAVFKMYQWLVHSIETNMPYDQFLRELMLADGNTIENPAANFFRSAGDTDSCTETAAETFLGIKIQCAKCHNHPYEKWTQDNYYGISALFNRIQRDDTNGNAKHVWVAREGEVTQPRTEKTMQPWLPDVGELNRTKEGAREMLADWLTQNDNRFVAVVEVNRVWSYLMGRGIVDPIDDFRDSNPATNSELLNELAKHFVTNGFDRKELIRLIVSSRTYQSSSLSNDQNRSDTKYFSHYPVRRLSAEQIVDAICRVTGVAEVYDGLPAGTLTTQLPNPKYSNEFLRIFGKPARNTACACERSESSDLTQALELVNGKMLDDKLRHQQNRFRKMLAAGESIESIVQDLYWVAYSRPPTDSELTKAKEFIQSAAVQQTAFEDLVWTIVNRKEFLFQH